MRTWTYAGKEYPFDPDTSAEIDERVQRAKDREMEGGLTALEHYDRTLDVALEVEVDGTIVDPWGGPTYGGPVNVKG